MLAVYAVVISITVCFSYLPLSCNNLRLSVTVVSGVGLYHLSIRDHYANQYGEFLYQASS